MHLKQLWQWQGRVDRLPYLLWGVLLLGIKYNLDRLTALLGFETVWYPTSYFYHPAINASLENTAAAAPELWLMLLLTALPFIAFGIGLTLQRLRSAALPLGLCVLFFVPLINLLFFLLLALWPARSEAQRSIEEHGKNPSSRWQAFFPRSAPGSALVGVLSSVLLGLPLIGLLMAGLELYGYALFVGLPFMMGLVAVLLFSLNEPRSLKACLGVAMLSVGIFALLLLLLAVEGVICLIMAAPLGIPLVLLGGWVGWLMQKQRRPAACPGLALFLLLPLLMGFERAADLPAPLFAVRTTIEIEAPPETVWQHVVSFSELPPPSDWVLQTGIAYPLRAEIRGTGVGAVRYCVFSTGPFIEPITVWEAPRLLRFDVSAQPATMDELSPYGIHPPHLDNFLRSRQGQFLLTPLANGGTRLEGTTWYEHAIWPAQYWRIWSDFIIHRIHWRVLSHIQNLAEAQHNQQP
ncbi:MAG: SRPBCC family protein [Candidatus Sericytochromatia bacterium]|nr:SRPBCC family protein [Candidatus Sericytochromatia bacterium]